MKLEYLTGQFVHAIYSPDGSVDGPLLRVGGSSVQVVMDDKHSAREALWLLAAECDVELGPRWNVHQRRIVRLTLFIDCTKLCQFAESPSTRPTTIFK